MSLPPALEASGITVRYGQIAALTNVAITVGRGEIVALMGDNGAGKSTLIKVISGALRPASGKILIDGEPAQIRTPENARCLGIETVYQDLALAPHVSVARNFFLGREILRPGLLSWLGLLDDPAMLRETQEALTELDVRIPGIRNPVQDLSGGQRQGIAIARAARWVRALLILDEPTAALGVQQTGRVLDIIRSVAARNTAIILISHNLPHVLQVADRIVVLRQGQVELACPVNATSPEKILSAMLGVGLKEAVA